MSTKQGESSYTIAEQVSISYDSGLLIVQGRKGRVVKDLRHIPADINIAENKVFVKIPGRSRKSKALLGTVISIIRNAVEGVTNGYTYRMKVVSSHFPITVKVVGNEVVISNFIGERYERRASIVGDAKVTVKGDEIIITGVDKDSVGQTAANIENATKIGRKDPRKFLDGIYVMEKKVGM
ncbi:MAG: 50S ribosomal protein L6 [Candidatus Caldarchaeum sp.]